MDMLVGGEWESSPKTEEVRYPYDDSVVDTVPLATPEQVNRAISLAVEGFQEMKRTTSLFRYKFLHRTAELIRENLEDLAATLTREMGKLISESRAEISRSADVFDLAGEEAKRIGGEVEPMDYQPQGEGKIAFWRRVPKGVVLCISPFNFPVLLSVHKIAPALAAGNSVVCKPALKTPLAVLKIGGLLLEAGCPKRALSIITGAGRTVGDALLSDPRVAMITFTGSEEVGEQIGLKAGIREVGLELGSNGPVIVTETAKDLPDVAQKVARGGVFNAGQQCISTQRVLVQERIFDEFKKLLIDEFAKMRVGDPFDLSTDVAPMVSCEGATKVQEWVDEAVGQGATLEVGGQVDGTRYQPAVLSNVREDMKVWRDEVFGPIVVLMPFKAPEEAFEIVNRSRFGLHGAIFTADIQVAMRAHQEIEVGTLMVNWIPGFRVDNMPFGGVKRSGVGREGVRFAIEEMTDRRLVVFQV